MTNLYSKVDDRDLIHFAESADVDANALREVIVELANVPKGRPPAYLLQSRGFPSSDRPNVSDVANPIVATQAQMDALERAIAALQPPEDPQRIPIASAFALMVTPELLQQLADLPLVGVIRPNREHHAKKAGAHAAI